MSPHRFASLLGFLPGPGERRQPLSFTADGQVESTWYFHESGGRVEVNWRDWPDEVEDGKSFSVYWADGRARVCYRYKKDAQEFADKCARDRDLDAVKYEDKPDGARLRSSTSA